MRSLLIPEALKLPKRSFLDFLKRKSGNRLGSAAETPCGMETALQPSLQPRVRSPKSTLLPAMVCIALGRDEFIS